MAPQAPRTQSCLPMINLPTPNTSHHSAIIGLGAYRPSRVVKNDELAARIDSSDEWIRERTGITERRFAGPDETIVTMGFEAAKQALEQAEINASDIDVVIVATFTHRYQTPSASAEIATLIGATNASAFDVGAACAGFTYGIGIADALIRAGSATNVLLIGTEKISDFTNFDDRGTAFLFADGAGAAIIAQSDVQGIGPTVWGADGAARDAIIMAPDTVTAGLQGVPSLLTMEGQRVFRWAVGSMGEVCDRALVAAGVTPDDIKAFVPHQANLRITDALVKRLKFPESVIIARDVTVSGNTSSASIPLALDALRQAGSVKSGDPVLMVGFGAGLAFAAQVALVP
jgi:3-oxoacyl-[acyl-carrier-protein] synthase-3